LKVLTSKNYFKRIRKKNLVFKTLCYALLLDNLAYAKFKLNETDEFQIILSILKLKDSLNLISGILVNKIHLSEYFASKMILLMH
jgi:hypothetical protein